jgi:organic hydroperoxide reductase OsmC/OhrA
MPAPTPSHRFDCRLVWTGATRGPTVSYDTYSRECRVDFPGKPSLKMSSAPVFRGDPVIHDPEDLLVAALSVCHFLSYAALCARAGIHVVAYEDDASAVMERVGRVFKFTDALLKPRVTLAAGSDPEKARALHEEAHATCFIAASVNFPVRHEVSVSVMAPV